MKNKFESFFWIVPILIGVGLIAISYIGKLNKNLGVSKPVITAEQERDRPQQEIRASCENYDFKLSCSPWVNNSKNTSLLKSVQDNDEIHASINLDVKLILNDLSSGIYKSIFYDVFSFSSKLTIFFRDESNALKIGYYYYRGCMDSSNDPSKFNLFAISQVIPEIRDENFENFINELDTKIGVKADRLISENMKGSELHVSKWSLQDEIVYFSAYNSSYRGPGNILRVGKKEWLNYLNEIEKCEKAKLIEEQKKTSKAEKDVMNNL